MRAIVVTLTRKKEAQSIVITGAWADWPAEKMLDFARRLAKGYGKVLESVETVDVPDVL